MTETLTIPQKKVVPAEEPPTDMVIYWPNDNAVLPQKYEDGLSGNTASNVGTGQPIDYSVSPDGAGYGLSAYTSNFTPGIHSLWPDRYNYGLNNNGPDSTLSKVGNETLSDIVVGDTIGAHGPVTGTTVKATHIMDDVNMLKKIQQ